MGYHGSPMNATGQEPLIVQNDGSILLDLHSPNAELARGHLSGFAELVSSPEHMHTYRVNDLTLWNAAAAGLDTTSILSALESWSRYGIPASLRFRIKEALSRWGSLSLCPGSSEGELFLMVHDPDLLPELSARRELRSLIMPHPQMELCFTLGAMDRGTLKQTLMRLGYPVKDEIPLKPGAPFPIHLKGQIGQTSMASDGKVSTVELTGPGADLTGPGGKLGTWSVASSQAAFSLRPYQLGARDAFLGGGLPGNGYGVVVLPCGAGKTIVGIATMAALGFETLILCPNVSAARQWIREILDRTDVKSEDVGEYSGESKLIRPITVATYQILTWRNEESGEFPHFGLFGSRNWGCIIYDEVHLLPAPVFRMTAEIQSKHRLGLTATLVREDGLETDVFSLVGPKRFDIPWKDMEAAGWIAKARCTEYRVPLAPAERGLYVAAKPREQARISACNSRKLDCVEALIHKHSGEHILVIGQYIDQLEEAAKRLRAPFISGSMPNARREELYTAFREGRERVLVVSKVANFAIDLPDASVAIQISGTFGSRQEEAQRLGRIMRPKERQANFYSLVSRMTVEEEYSQNRQRFLGEQGYTYHIDLWESERP